jgi:hypothetical protein
MCHREGNTLFLHILVGQSHHIPLTKQINKFQFCPLLEHYYFPLLEILAIINVNHSIVNTNTCTTSPSQVKIY